MRRNNSVFAAVAQNLTRIDEIRKAAVAEAFSVLEQHDPEVADILLTQFGDRKRAASWMCASQRCLDGRTAYQALADGDIDGLWDLIAGDSVRDGISPDRV
ncbi:DUF2384 domain-containing protein [Rhodanobacter sp. MP7CTX1]|uniref:DUF2384 domain-containing protein n=1 Tax=Rhodanobacter sp. MP7CTX1 TaxID=2723084 RepID=UPI001612BC8B|nr:DUF2384 domain-containing protein [Rhodanobacter sp. MP7CTX1]MBB6187519.1 hypothetical protein [Rhodanobacter sp. MP7CTX1]